MRLNSKLRSNLSALILLFALIAALNSASVGVRAQQAGVLTNLEIGSYKTPIEYLRFPLDQPLSASRFDYTATVSDQYTAKFFVTATVPANTDATIKIDGVAVKSGQLYAVDLAAGPRKFVITVETSEAPSAIYNLTVDRKDLFKVYTSESLGRGLWRIYDFGGTRGDESFYLVEGTTRALLLDAGMGKGDLAGYVRTLTKLPVAVAVTHGHGDHFGQVNDFKDSDIYIGEQDITRLPHDYITPKFHYIKDGDKIDLGGGHVFEAINVPGHTIGSMIYLDRMDKIAVTGDAVSSGSMVYMFGGNCTALDQYVESLKHLQSKLANVDGLQLLVGHAYQEKTPLVGAAAQQLIADMRTAGEGALAGTTQGKQVFNTGPGGAKSELRELNVGEAGLWYNPANMRTAPAALGMLDITTQTGTYLIWKAVFASMLTDYTVTVPDQSTTVEVTPTAYWQYAKSITVNGAAVKSGSKHAVQLAPGINKIEIAVTGNDGSTRTYTVSIQR
jgi:glyoxylase-like metal-dependent hydrolase (beta-lactamase superfamily II)